MLPMIDAEQRIEINVTGEKRRLAEIAAGSAARVLGIPTPQIRFFHGGRYDSLKGFYQRSEGILINANLSDHETITAVVHEMRHAWQLTRPEWLNRSEQLQENDAWLFAMEWPRDESEKRAFVERYMPERRMA